jgi:predicted small secreted protein
MNAREREWPGSRVKSAGILDMRQAEKVCRDDFSNGRSWWHIVAKDTASAARPRERNTCRFTIRFRPEIRTIVSIGSADVTEQSKEGKQKIKNKKSTANPPAMSARRDAINRVANLVAIVSIVGLSTAIISLFVEFLLAACNTTSAFGLEPGSQSCRTKPLPVGASRMLFQ